MRHLARTARTLALLALAWAGTAAVLTGSAEKGPQRRAAAAASATAATDEARVIVHYRAGSTLAQPAAADRRERPLHADVLGGRLGLALRDRWALGERTQSLVARGAGIAADELARRIAAQPEVEWAEPVQRRRIAAVTPAPDDPLFPDVPTDLDHSGSQWYLHQPYVAVSAIDAENAWDVTRGDRSVAVAVLDTGILPHHPDFTNADGSSQLRAGYDFVSHRDTWADGGGRDSDPTDPGDGDDGHDHVWHGTRVASIVAAATDNGVGMAGVAPKSTLLPVRVLGPGGGWDDDIQAGMLWAAGLSDDPVANPNPARVINMSLGGEGTCPQSYRLVIQRLIDAKVVVVAAAGNGDADGGAVDVPGNCPGVIAVGGLRHAGTKVGYSSLGTEVAISAPAGNCVNVGENDPCVYQILAATNIGDTVSSSSYGWTDGLNYNVGTSFSTPMVSGAAALLLALEPGLTPAQVKGVLQATARSFAAVSSLNTCSTADPTAECNCTTSTCGAGMLNVAAAVALPPLVTLSASTTHPAAGSQVTLDADVTAFRGRTLTATSWYITSGRGTSGVLQNIDAGGFAAGQHAVLEALNPGTVRLAFSATDSDGHTTHSQLTLTVQEPTSSNPSSSGGGGGGGGGGALSPAVLLLGLALAALRRRGSGV